MYYMERGLGLKWLGLLFAFFCMLASFGIGGMIQSHSHGRRLSQSFGVPPLLTGLLTALLAGLVVLGGVRRIGAVTEKLVPAMVGGLSAGGGTVPRLPCRSDSCRTGPDCDRCPHTRGHGRRRRIRPFFGAAHGRQPGAVLQ